MNAEILLIILVIAAVLFYVLRNPRPIDSYVAPEKPQVIVDDSHLKAQLAALQSSFTAAQQELGQLQLKLRQSNEQLSSITAAKFAGDEALAKVTGQKKSGEVRLGQISEQLVCLLPDFPVPINTLKFFGNPLDYISIDLDEEWISFIEVKSGGAVLSDKQKKIRKMIQDKRVRFFEVRIDEKGMKVK